MRAVNAATVTEHASRRHDKHPLYEISRGVER